MQANHIWEMTGICTAVGIWGCLAFLILFPHVKRQFVALTLQAKHTPFRMALGVIAVGLAVAYAGTKPQPPEPVVTNTITYLNLEGAANPNPATFTTNDLPLALAPLTREGWRFLGWTPQGGVIPAGTVTNVTFAAQWEEIVEPPVPPPGPDPIYEGDFRGDPEDVVIDKVEPTIFSGVTMTFGGEAMAVGDKVGLYRTVDGVLCGYGEVVEYKGAAQLTLSMQVKEGTSVRFEGWQASSRKAYAMRVTLGDMRDADTLSMPEPGSVVAGLSLAAMSGTPVPPEPPVDPVEPVVTNTITYLNLEGAANTNVTEFTTNDLPLALGPVEREGWRFLGWTPDGGVIPAGTVTNVTFAAQWEEIVEPPVGPDPVVTSKGEYVKFDLVDDLGVEIPDDVDYAKGDKVTVKVEGLAKGLKLAQDKTSKAWIVSGVPTDEIDFERNPMYARVTVTYKDKAKGVKGKAESLQPVVLSIVTQEPTALAAGVLNEAYEPADIAELWPAVADAKDNPKEWSFKGWPSGIKYTTKDVTKKNKDKSVTTIASAYSVYGTPTKAGEFAITATHKHKLADGKTTVSETFSAVLTVWGDDGATDFRYTDQAYGAAVDATIADAKSVSGLPTGLKFDKATGKVTGTPTKAGVFAVTATKADPSDPKGKKTVKETFLWKVEPGENGGVLGEIGWKVADSAVTVMQGVVQGWPVAMPDGAKVTASGLPAGLKLVQDKKTRAWTISGTPTKAGNFVATFKTVRNGVTVTERISIVVTANEWEGKWYGVQSGDADASLLGEVTVSANGTVKLVYTEGSTNTSAKGAVQGAVRKTTVTVKNLDADGTAATLTLPRDKKDKSSVDRVCVLDFEKGELTVDGVLRMHLAEVDTGWVAHDVTTVVMEEVLGGETNAYGYVTATYKSGKFTLAGKLWDGTAVKGTAYPLGFGESFSPVMVTDKAKNSVAITLGGTGGDAVVLVRENGRALSIGSSGTIPWSAGFAAADLKSKKFNVTYDKRAKSGTGMTTAETLVILKEGGAELALSIPEKSLAAAVSAQGLVKFTITDEDGWKWVSELLPVDNGGETQFRGIATGTKSRQPTQVCPVWAE